MFIFTPEMLNEYLSHDALFKPMYGAEIEAKKMKSHEWMIVDPAKRCTFWYMYKDLLYGTVPKSTKVLDVAGGYSGMSKLVAENCKYTLVDILAHDDQKIVKELAVRNKHSWVGTTWQDFVPQEYDLIICNDLFVNVDQSLELFLKKYLPVCKEMRLLLTFHNTPLTYTLQDTRSGHKEIYTMMAWNGEQLETLLKKYAERIELYSPHILRSQDSIFKNGRQVCQLTIYGDLHER